jgi:hypothetical protein
MHEQLLGLLLDCIHAMPFSEFDELACRAGAQWTLP